MTERFLIFAPRGRDAAIIAQVLERGGLVCDVCPGLAELWSQLDGDVGGVLVTEEALETGGVQPLLDWVEAQPPWSDLPIIVLAPRQLGLRPPAAALVLERLGNVMLIERPINAETLLRGAEGALRARRRQYQARGMLQERERSEAELRRLNETLEQRVAARTRELEAAHETLAFALDSAGMGSWDLDLVSDTSRRSGQHDAIFGFTEHQEVWGAREFLSAVIEDDRMPVAAAFDQALKSGTLDIECRIKQAGDGVRWIVAKGRVEYEEASGGAARRPVRMAGIVMDTTGRRLTEDALHQAQKMEAIGQLTGGVAHDFNNLLTVIVGGLDMVIRKPERTERVVRLAEAAMTAARRGEQLTQQLLAFSRRQMLRPETLDPRRLLHEFEALAKRAVGEAVELVFEFAPAIHPVRVDPAQLESAVLNLVVNARDAIIQAGKAGGSGRAAGRITVTCRNVDLEQDLAVERTLAPGAYVEVAVADTGSGLDARTLARAFEPFFTTKEIGKGSGLGLSQVYGFMRSAGGDVLIESELGIGTTVRLLLPRSPDAVVEQKQAVVDSLPLRPAANDETVLLVEDDEQVLDMAIESLQELRYKVVVSRNASEALEYLNSDDPIDVLFSDVVMPGGMNGAELAIEAQRLRPGLKVLLTSGYVGEVGAGQVVGGGLPVLTKPYRRDELAHKLRMVLGQV
ncbi:ATP-binding protein [Lichenicola sp.]|uniref:PAS domain-containing hybrid sensor histidine kinase/response regulator n=1 Tax=Lichenicola sp. TaxID=2804529 RepID=UPI003B00F6B3